MFCKFLKILSFVFFITSSESLQFSSQNEPDIPCPDLFKYKKGGNFPYHRSSHGGYGDYGSTIIYGKHGGYDSNEWNYGWITIKGTPSEAIKVEAQFKQWEPILTEFKGALGLVDSWQAAQSKLINGEPIDLRVDFPDPSLFPQLQYIKVNDEIICKDHSYASPPVEFTVQKTINTPNPTESPPSEPKYLTANNFYGPSNGSFAIQSLPRSPPITSTTQRSPTTMAATLRTTALKPAANCGVGGSSFSTFLAGGLEIKRGRFPWLTAIYLRKGADLKFVCGGSLISTRTVITAAHCFLDPKITADHIVVFLGRHNLFASEIGVEQRDVETLIKHPEFNISAVADADIALLHMRTPVSYTSYIRPICLWSSAIGTSSESGVITGWGADNNGLEITPLPKMVEVDIVSETECLRSSDFFRTVTSPRSLCAGKRDGTGPCIGDSGGGLMVNNAGVWILRAIISFGITKNTHNHFVCDLDEYVVYCDLSKHADWVHSNML